MIFSTHRPLPLSQRALNHRKGDASSLSLCDLPRDIARAEGNTSLSIVQERMLRIEREVPGLPQFNLSLRVSAAGPLNVPALERSLAEVASRHASLRTGFSWLDETARCSHYSGGDVKVPVIVADLTVLRVDRKSPS